MLEKIDLQIIVDVMVSADVQGIVWKVPDQTLPFPVPKLKTKGESRSLDESKTVPSSNVPT